MLTSYPHIESEDTRYAFAVGRIRALETQLLAPHRVARFLETKDADELLRGFQDTGYSPYLPSEPIHYEDAIKGARQELYNLAGKLILDDIFTQALKLRYDYHNVKVLLKSAIGEKPYSGLLSDLGNVPRQEIETVFQEEVYYKLKFLLPQAIAVAVADYYASKDPKIIDIILDKYYYYYLSKITENVFFNTIIKIQIDLINLKTELRIKWLKEEKSLFAKAFIPGGYLELARFFNSFDEPIDAIPRYFEVTPYASIFDEGVSFLTAKNSFARLEKLCDDHLTEFLRCSKFLAFGVEPILAYFYAKENEFKILRMLFVSKINAVPDEIVRERLPEVY